MQGVLAAYAEIDSAVEAIQELRKKNFSDITVFTPTPRHEFEEVLAHPASGVRKFTLIGGLLGVTFGYWIAIWISDYWPLVVGGKPVASWIPYTIIGFEVFVLVGALSTVAAMFINSRIPKITSTTGFDPRFTHGDFGIYVEAAPERLKEAEETLREHGAVEVRGES